ncbi:MAG: chemotaxis response regulator protein-glutamate methylesterase [Alphaproteobacteria bacterium]
MSEAEQKIRIILVDDSAVIRGALARLLESDPAIQIVSSVSNGALAVSAAQRYKPDIVILDIEMPEMDGLRALPLIKAASPNTKVVMFSALTQKGAEITMKALALGAVECLVKPSSGEAQSGGAFHERLLSLIHSLRAGVSVLVTAPAFVPLPKSVSTPLPTPKKSPSFKPQILAIGSSTGGPQALHSVLKHCRNLPVPIVITQHMPPTFTRVLAEHITKNTGVAACEGADGMTLEAGKAYIAPGGYHMLFAREGEGPHAKTKIVLDNGAAVNYCKPAVDPMLQSLVKLFSGNIVTIILTGMGHDGLDGCRALHAQGGSVIAQDEQTSVVWGMPGAVAQAGLCDKILPLEEIGSFAAGVFKC